VQNLGILGYSQGQMAVRLFVQIEAFELLERRHPAVSRFYHGLSRQFALDAEFPPLVVGRDQPRPVGDTGPEWRDLPDRSGSAALVSTCRAEITAPGAAAPVESVTRPVIVPRNSWDTAGSASRQPVAIAPESSWRNARLGILPGHSADTRADPAGG
jgi:hypothetical protein